MEELTLEQLQARLATAETEKAQAIAEKTAAEQRAEDAQAEKTALERANDKLSEAHEELQQSHAELEEKLSAAEKEAAKNEPVSFETEDGEYEFTCPKFTWDDNKVYNVRELANDESQKGQEFYAEICAKLVQRNSGIISRKED
jgi:chromosome segregation ATPase